MSYVWDGGLAGKKERTTRGTLENENSTVRPAITQCDKKLGEKRKKPLPSGGGTPTKGRHRSWCGALRGISFNWKEVEKRRAAQRPEPPHEKGAFTEGGGQPWG